MYQIHPHAWEKVVRKYTTTLKELPWDDRVSNMFPIFCFFIKKKSTFSTEHEYFIFICFYTQFIL